MRNAGALVAFCRDTEVIITSWTDVVVPWPHYHAVFLSYAFGVWCARAQLLVTSPSRVLCAIRTIRPGAFPSGRGFLLTEVVMAEHTIPVPSGYLKHGFKLEC